MTGHYVLANEDNTRKRFLTLGNAHGEKATGALDSRAMTVSAAA